MLNLDDYEKALNDRRCRFYKSCGYCFIFAIFVLIAVLFGACSRYSNYESIKYSTVLPNVTRYTSNLSNTDGAIIDDGYYYLVDNNTDVVYLIYSEYHQFGITPLLNSDGTPVSKNQLELP